MFAVKFKQIILRSYKLQCPLNDLLSLVMVSLSLLMNKNRASVRKFSEASQIYTAALLIMNDIPLRRPLRPHIYSNMFIAGPVNADHITYLQRVVVHTNRL